MKFQGFDISIENRKGSVRHWYDKTTDTHGETKMEFPYGYIRLTEGTDGDHVDVFVGGDEQAKNAYVIHQMRAPDFKTFDEDKVMLGFASAKEAKQAYLRHFDSPKFFGSMTAMPVEQFRKKVFRMKRKMIKSKRTEDQLRFDFDKPVGAKVHQGGPYIGPRGGKWADPQHMIPWKEEKPESKTPYTTPERAETRRKVLGHGAELVAVTTVFVNVSGGSEKKQFVATQIGQGVDLASKNVGAQITAHEVPNSEKGRRRFTQYAQQQGLRLMVDSGEFGRFAKAIRAKKEGKPEPELDFDKVFTAYEKLAEDMPAGTLTVVAPDRIADPKMTAQLREKYADRVKALMDKGAEVLVPIQARSAEEIGKDYIEAIKLFGEGITLGFPTAAAVLPMDQILPAMAQLYAHGKFPRVHFLGGGRPREMAERTVQLVAAAYFAGRGLDPDKVMDLVKTPDAAARALRNVKTGDILVTAESDIALHDRMMSWARERGVDPDHEDFDETEAWIPFFEDYPEEFHLELDAEDKPKLFRDMARKLVQMDSRVVGSLQQYGLQHDPVTGKQVKAGEKIQAIPKKDRHPATLEAYLEAREHQTERYTPSGSSAWHALWGEFEKSGRRLLGWVKAVQSVGIPLEQFHLVVKYARQGHQEARKALDAVYAELAKGGESNQLGATTMPVGTMGNWGESARTAGENVRSHKVGEPREDWPPNKQDMKKKNRRPKRNLPKAAEKMDVSGNTRGKGWANVPKIEETTGLVPELRPQDSKDAHESLKVQQRSRMELREGSKISDVEIHR